MALRSTWQANKAEVVARNGVVTAMQPQSAEAASPCCRQAATP